MRGMVVGEGGRSSGVLLYTFVYACMDAYNLPEIIATIIVIAIAVAVAVAVVYCCRIHLIGLRQVKVRKGSFFIHYSAVSSPLDRSKRFTLFAFPDRPVHSDTNSASPGSILAMQQLRATTKSLTFPPLSIARYSFIQLIQQGRQWREGKCPIFQTVAKGNSNPGLLDCESGILPLSYRAPYHVRHINVAASNFLEQENIVSSR